jgi:hypothetical protein
MCAGRLRRVEAPLAGICSRSAGPKFHSTQNAYKEKYGKFAYSVNDLVESGFLDKGLLRPNLTDTDDTYEFRIDALLFGKGGEIKRTEAGDPVVSYIVTATPRHPDQYRFYSRPGDGIRFEKGSPATANSPRFAVKAN